MNGQPAHPAWRVEHVHGLAGDAHAADLTSAGATRLVRLHVVTVPALVLGSGQAESVVDRAAVARAGVDVVRRRSGGGAVLVTPEDVAWVDVVIPAGDPLWHDDVRRAGEWLGECWGRALTASGLADLTVHRGALQRTRWSSLVCFASLGPGEVTSRGRKVVGISQRRTRHAARFQIAALARWDVVGILGLLALSPADRAAATAALADAAIGAPATPDSLMAAFVATLPA